MLTNQFEIPTLPFTLTDLLPSFLEQKPADRFDSNLELEQIKPINNPEQDKTIVILNFILKEVLPIKDRTKQKELLVYFFKSILSETQKLPITHLAYEIVHKKSGKLALHDDVYLLRPDLLQICQEAIESLAISYVEKDRYNLEKDQIENLLAVLESLFRLTPHAILSLLSQQETTTPNLVDTNKTKESLELTGWQTLPPPKAFSFIQPEVKEKMKLEKLTGEITVGPKYLYIMPQSAVHEGNLSIIVLAQPVFIPSLNRFILLHDQHMSPKNWSDHEQLFKKLKVELPIDFSNLEFAEKEKLVMEKLVKLPKEFQATTASEAFFKLFPEKKFLNRLRQKITRQKIKGMEKSLAEYAELVIDVVGTEVTNDPNLFSSTVNKLTNFMNRVVFAGILDVKKISSAKRNTLFRHFKKFGDLAERDFALSLKNIGFSSAVKAFDTSLLECVALSPLSSVQQLAKLNGFSPNSLTRVDLGKFIGEKRSKDWKMGACVRCGAFNTWVGECNWCLTCELNYNSPKTNSSTQKNNLPKTSLPSKKTSIFTENLGSFIANLV